MNCLRPISHSFRNSADKLLICRSTLKRLANSCMYELFVFLLMLRIFMKSVPLYSKKLITFCSAFLLIRSKKAALLCVVVVQGALRVCMIGANRAQACLSTSRKLAYALSPPVSSRTYWRIWAR